METGNAGLGGVHGDLWGEEHRRRDESGAVGTLALVDSATPEEGHTACPADPGASCREAYRAAVGGPHASHG